MATTTHPHVTVEPRWAGPILVRGTQIIGTDQVVFSAWEPSGNLTEGRHSTVTHVDGRLLGRVGTTAPGAWLERMEPGSAERIEAAREHYRLDKARAAGAVLEAFPGLAGVARVAEGSGELWCAVADLEAAIR